MKFREDIQGLRALAVLSVVIYHLSPNFLTGGFIGVDIFFVISGYLIIGQIIRKIEENNFRLLDFYAKRVKRLYPAFFVVTLASTIFAFVYFLPGEFESYAFSLISSYFYISNFYFYTKSGYFDSELQNAPLLHTWSLSVEEQFYLLIPIILLLSFKFYKQSLPIIIAIVGIVSFFLCLAISYFNIDFAFFSSFTRFWQFVVGGLISTLTIRTLSVRTKNYLAASSLCSLIVCIFFMSHNDFPGIKALIPTFATAIFLAYSSPGTLTYKVCSTNLANFFGNISYSFYLWHWPIIIFYQVYLDKGLNRFDKLSVLAASIALGTITYYFVEQKFRKPNVSNYKTFSYSASTTFIMLFSILIMTHINGLRFTKEQVYYESFLAYEAKEYRRGTCFLTSQFSHFSLFNQQECIVNEEGKKNIALIGDSHAAHWYSALKKNLTPDQTLSQITSSGCKPTIFTQGEKRCVDLIDWAYQEIVNESNFDQVILSARWESSDIANVIETVKLLENRGLEIVVMGPIIEYESALPRLLSLSSSTPESVNANAKYLQISQTDNIFKNSLASYGVEYISVLKSICNSPNDCTTLVKGEPIQFDYGHLTETGAIFLLNEIQISKK